jgi:hypothetical protein
MSYSIRPILLIAVCSVIAAFVSMHYRQDSSASSASTLGWPDERIPLERSAGRRDAPIRIDVFNDFQCSGCAEFHLQTLARLRDDYCATGKVYLVHHEYPLPIPSHAYARNAARWALAATAVGKYELVADALFRDQARWAKSGDIEGTVSSVLTLQELSRVKRTLDTDAEAIGTALEQDRALGRSFPVHGTPSFRILLHGREVFADHDEPDKITPSTPRLKTYENLKRYLDEQLVK